MLSVKDSPPENPQDSDRGDKGDYICPKEPFTLRIAGGNIGGLAPTNNDPKNDQLIDFIDEKEVDIAVLIETNQCWRNVKKSDRIVPRFRHRWESFHSAVAYNTQDRTLRSPRQYGGNAIISRDQAAHRAVQSGSDDTGLGRWAWTRYQGTKGIHLRVVAAYRPNHRSGDDGVYAQHQDYLNAHDDDRCPRQAFLEDLRDEAKQWLAMGDQLVIFLDANQDVNHSDLQTLFGSDGLDMINVHQDTHGANLGPTHNRGTVTIDGVWTTRGLSVAGCGLRGFERGMGGDHKHLWMDISFISAFGSNVPDVVRPPARRLKLRDPRTVQRYLAALKSFMKRHKLRQRVLKLEEDAEFPPSAESRQEYERLDTLRIQAIRYADRRCRKLCMGKVPWSPELKSRRDKIRLLRALIKRRQRLKVSSRMISRLKKRVNDPSLHPLSLDDLELKLREAAREYRQFAKSKAETSRKSFLERLADALADEGQTDAAQQLRNLQHREAQRDQARRIRPITGKMARSAMTRLTATVRNPDGTEEVVELHHKDEMELAALREYETRLRCTEDTPFLTEPLVHKFGYSAMTPSSKEVLQGTFVPPPDTDPHTTRWIEQNKYVQPPPGRPIVRPRDRISTEYHIRGWDKVAERTAPGHSGTTAAHFKAACKDPYTADVDAGLSNFPWVTGHSPKRWQKSVDLLIRKKAGDDSVEGSRPIVLFEIDSNKNHKILGREMMAAAEANEGLAPEQYGSRKGHSAADQALNKRLLFDLMRQKRHPATDTAVDLKSCYDLVAHAPASISMQRQHLQEPPIVCMMTTLQNMVHTVRTAFGDSERSFGGELYAVPFAPPPMGVGQGNGAGPAIWAVVSTPVLNMLRAEGHGASFKLAISGDSIHLVGFAFVDDGDVVQTASCPHIPPEDLIKEGQKGLDCYVGGMRATGAKVRPDKCWWYLIKFAWTDGEWRYVTKEESIAEDCLSVPDLNGADTPIERLDPSEARKALGVWLAPDGNNDMAVEKLQKASKAWADRLRAGHLNQIDAWTAFQTTILKTVEYPLVALTLTSKECTKIEWPMLRAAMSSSGAPQNVAKEVRQGPRLYQGLDHKPLYFTQGLRHIEALQRHGKSDSITGRLIRTSVEALKLETGSPDSLFSTDFALFGPLATSSWCTHTWQFLSENDILVEEDTPNLQPRRDHDEFLIPAFLAAGVKGKRLLQANRCRLYLQATSLADIASGDGREIMENAWSGHRDPFRTPYYQWPVQQRPADTDWREWRSALRSAFLDPARPSRRTLNRPLGEWIVNAAEPRWEWYFSPSEKRIYRVSNDQTSYFRPSSFRTRRRDHEPYAPGGTAAGLPEDALRTKVFRKSGSPYVHHTGTMTAAHSEPRTPTTLRASLRRGPSGRRWATRNTKVRDNGVAVARGIRRGEAVAVSDGSFKNGVATAAFEVRPHLNSRRKRDFIRGQNRPPGRPEDQSPYRGELSGIYGSICTLEQVCNVHDISEGAATVACDGKEALSMALDPARPLDPKCSDFDLLSAIRAKVRKMPITIVPHWVWGHQDSTPGASLDEWAEMNVQMDSRAKAHWAHVHRSAPGPDEAVEDESWSVYAGGKKITRHLPERLHVHCHGEPLLQYWSRAASYRPARYAPEVQDLIDWDASSAALAEVGLARRRWHLRHVTATCPTGNRMHQWQLWTHDRCPRCGRSENSAHIVTCHGTDDVWDDALNPLRSWIDKARAPMGMATAITDRLTAWRRNRRPRLPPSYWPDPLVQALTAQDRIGWAGFLEGCAAKEWRALMDGHFERRGSQRSGRRFVIGLIKSAWQTVHDLWEHRNAVLHNDVASMEARDQERKMDSLIAEHHSRGPDGLPARYRRKFAVPLPVLLARPSQTREAWLKTVVLARERLARWDGTSCTHAAEADLMRTWLGRRSRRPQASRLYAAQRRRRRRRETPVAAPVHLGPQQDDD